MAQSMKLGGGGRFAKLKKSLSGKVSDPGAVAASIGRKKYGASKCLACPQTHVGDANAE